MGFFDDFFGGKVQGGWGDVSEKTSTSDTLGIKTPKVQSGTGSGWDSVKSDLDKAGTPWSKVKSDF